MPDFSSDQFQSSLADTIAWCNIKAIDMHADSDDIRRRHALYAQAEKDLEDAQETVERGWLRRQWQNAMSLLKQLLRFPRTYGP